MELASNPAPGQALTFPSGYHVAGGSACLWRNAATCSGHMESAHQSDLPGSWDPPHAPHAGACYVLLGDMTRVQTAPAIIHHSFSALQSLSRPIQVPRVTLSRSLTIASLLAIVFLLSGVSRYVVTLMYRPKRTGEVHGVAA